MLLHEEDLLVFESSEEFVLLSLPSLFDTTSVKGSVFSLHGLASSPAVVGNGLVAVFVLQSDESISECLFSETVSSLSFASEFLFSSVSSHCF